MRLCSRCHETLEETFDVCWNCGTATDGTVDPNFELEAVGLPAPPPADVDSQPRREQDAATELETAASTDGHFGPRWLSALVWSLWIAFWATLLATCVGGGTAYLLVRRFAGAASYYGDIAEVFYVLGTAIVSAAIVGFAVFILMVKSEMRGLTNPRQDELDLSARNVTDADLARLPPMPHLWRLSLSFTRVTDAGLVVLRSFPNSGSYA